MPMIALTVPVGALDGTARRHLRKALPAALLKWEGAPDTAFFRAQAWCRIDETPGGIFLALEDDLPRFRVDVTVPEGALSARRKEGLVAEVTQLVVAAAGLYPADAVRVWVLIHEQPEGSWGAGGDVIRFRDLKALADKEIR